MQDVGGVPPMLLPEAYTVLTWEWNQLLSAPWSGAAPYPIFLMLLLPICFQSLLYSALSESLKAFTSLPALS